MKSIMNFVKCVKWVVLLNRFIKPFALMEKRMITMDKYKELERPDKATGFASPALGYEAKTLDFNTLLRVGSPSVYCYRQSSRDMERCGIAEGSILIVDRARKPRNGSIVVFTKGGSFYCRKFQVPGSRLQAGNQRAVFTNEETDIFPDENTQIFGVVTFVIRSFGG
jgi:DNA polymerase V